MKHLNKKRLYTSLACHATINSTNYGDVEMSLTSLTGRFISLTERVNSSFHTGLQLSFTT